MYRKRQFTRRGISVVQVALVIPLLFAMTFAVIEYGWMFTKYGQLAHATREGARFGARDSATAAQVQATVNSYLNRAGINSNYATVVVTPSNLSTLAAGSPLTVTV